MTRLLAIASLALLGAFAANTASANQPLMCCQNANGTVHPVSSNGKAAASCESTFAIPSGENPAQYCAEGEPDRAALCAAETGAFACRSVVLPGNDSCDWEFVGDPTYASFCYLVEGRDDDILF